MISSKLFGEKDGQPIHLYTLRNSAGNEASVSTLGATLTQWTSPDRGGHIASVVLGYKTPGPYLSDSLPYFGPVVGRYANRIGGGRFVLDGKEYQLSQNEGENHLHGGFSGLDKKVWDAQSDGEALVLHCVSEDGEEGYPGTLDVIARFDLSADNTLTISYSATTDQPTVVNLTLHPWFNLSGIVGSAILDHELQICAAHYTPVGQGLIPTGHIAPVDGTPYDFRGARLLAEALPMLPNGGLDHNFILDGGQSALASLYHRESDRLLEIRTTEPGLQVYTAQGLDGSIHSEDGAPLPRYGAVVLEPQHFPDSPNHPQFPGTVLRPGEVFSSKSEYRLSVRG
jgi:aldose 1-epimerase